ncbi:MAG: hypothetical protein JXQ30_13820 [Spirochaetes bacterium]|nr:hypothetical protein [Spirochaetota bacterium]
MEKDEIYKVDRDIDLAEWEHNRIIVHLATFKRMMKVGEKDFPDMWALYGFYYAKARHDKTNKPWAVDRYCMKGLGWGKDRFYRIKKKLLDHKFIEQFTERRSGRYEKFYIKVNYISRYDQCPGNKDNGNSSPVSLKTGVREFPLVVNQDTNA